MTQRDYDQLPIQNLVLTLPDGRTIDLPTCRLNEIDAVVAEALRSGQSGHAD